jgi:hypothetical protein
VQADDEDAVTMAQVCGRAGVTVLRQPPATGRFKVGETLAVSTIRALINRRHAMGARRVLQVAVEGRLSPVSSGMIKAIERLLFDAEYSGEISEGDIAAILLGGHDLENEAKRFAAEHKQPVWRGLASVIWMKKRRRGRGR